MTIDQHHLLWDELGFDEHERRFMWAVINGCRTPSEVLRYCEMPTRKAWVKRCEDRLQGMHRKYKDWQRSVGRAIDVVTGKTLV